MVVDRLVRGHLRTRWRRYALVAGSFAVALTAFFGVLSVAQGAQSAVVEPLRDTIVGDVRVTQGTADVSAGAPWMDYRSDAAAIGRIPGASVAPRFESNYITVRGDQFQNWSAGLLLGIDPFDTNEHARQSRVLAWGKAITSIDVFDPDSNRAYTPVILGAPAVERLNLTLRDDQEPNFDQVLTLTSGRVVGGSSLPLTVECVVVGVFETSLEPLDRFSGMMPIHATRVLAGFNENDPVANALVVTGGDPEAIKAHVATHPPLQAETAEEFAFSYLGGMLVILAAAAVLTLVLFSVVLLVWLVHETGMLVRSDAPVISSLRAIGIPATAIQRSYTILVSGAIVAGAVVAAILSLALAAFAPPVQWTLEGLEAEIPWSVRPGALLVVALAAAGASLTTGWLTARRVQHLNILDGLRGA